MRIVVAALVVLLGLSGCARAASTPAAPLPPSASGSAPASGIPDGWRWEAYGGVRVAVPPSYGHGNGSQRLSQWCVDPDGERPPIVGRPGVTSLAGCGEGGDTLERTGPVVAFEDSTEPDGVTRGGDRITVELAGVRVIVQTPAGVREQIAATVGLAPGGACPERHPAASDPAWRPGPATDLATWGDVDRLVACRYRLATGGAEAVLISAPELTGPAARKAIAAMAAAPVGGGPDQPQNCLPDYRYGSEILVVRGHGDVVVRYSGCDHHGIDDGRTLRTLTKDVARALLSGPNRPDALIDGVHELVWE